MSFDVIASGVSISSIGTPVGMVLSSQSPLHVLSNSIVNINSEGNITVLSGGSQGILIKAQDGGNVDIVADSGNITINGETIEDIVCRVLRRKGIID
jgi:hypothetical protein